MPNSTVSNLYLVCSLLPPLQSWRKTCMHPVFPRYFVWLNNYTALLVYILLRLSLPQEHYCFDGICKLLCAEENDIILAKKTLKNMIQFCVSILNPEDGKENGCAWFFWFTFRILSFQNFRILSSNTKYFFLSQLENLGRQTCVIGTSTCPIYLWILFAHLWGLVKSHTNWKFSKVSENWCLRWVAAGRNAEGEAQQFPIPVATSRHRAASQVQMLSKYCLRGSYTSGRDWGT